MLSWAELIESPSFAWAEMRTVTVNLLSRYDIIEIPGQHIDYRQYITMQFSKGSWKVKMLPRYLQ